MKLISFISGILLLLCITLLPCSTNNCNGDLSIGGINRILELINAEKETESVILFNSTFLGCIQRNYYGDSAPSRLDELWHVELGSGTTFISKKEGSKVWSGAGWTGQPLIFMEDSIMYLMQGAYDHNLKKFNLETGELVWEYSYDDVIKGTGTIWRNPNAKNPEEEYVILQGSRMGVNRSLTDKEVPSFRAISLRTGKEIWRMNVKKTDSYSRDVDGTALILNDTAYIGLENGIFTVFNPAQGITTISDNYSRPQVYGEHMLYEEMDVSAHRKNLVTESAPCYLDGRIYITAGSGHIYGYNVKKRKIDWDFFTGSDIDGSPVVTADNCILVSLEKQYIKGPGGLLKLDPSKTPDSAVVWFFATGDKKVASWDGGLIGSPSVNDSYNDGSYPHMAAFSAIDGNLYVVDYTKTSGFRTSKSFDAGEDFPGPALLFKYPIGPSISTPIIVGNKIIAAGYEGIFLFEFDRYMHFTLLDHKPYGCEASPVTINGKVYIASRNGNLYCFGEK